MAFFLIVPSVMIIGVLLVHALANRLGLKIFYATLAAAAITTFPVTFAATKISPAIGRGYFLWLGFFIAATAGALTLANRFLLKKQREEEKNFHEEVLAAYEEEKKISTPATQKPIEKFSWGEEKIVPAYNESVDEKISDEPVDKKISDEPADEKISDEPADEKISDEPVDEKISDEPVDQKISDEPVDEKISDEPVDEKISDEPVDEKISDEPVDQKISAENELNEKPALPENFPLEKIFEPLTEIKHEDADKPIELPEEPNDEEFPFDKIFKPLSEVKREEISPPPEKNSKPAEFVPLQEVFRPLSTLNLEKIEEITEEEKNLPHEEETNPEEKIVSLDDLLDKACEERDKGHVWQAIETYKKALERYRADEYAPFVAIDLCNIYKEQALYSEAIKVYEQALTLPALERNSSAKKEFAETLKYLRVVREILQKHHALSTPFSQLSKEILQEVDIEFKKLQINSRE